MGWVSNTPIFLQYFYLYYDVDSSQASLTIYPMIFDAVSKTWSHANTDNICVGDYVANHYRIYNEVIYKVTLINAKNVATLVPVINPDGTLVQKPTCWRKRTIPVTFLKRKTIASITETLEKTIESLKQLQGI